MADMTVANTILQQLGGNQFRAMTGARDLTGTDNSLTVKLGKMSGVKTSHIRVTLDPSDTYTVEFLAVRGTSIKTLSTHSDVYAENLRGLFERETGLRTSLTNVYA